jgi:hypothetical protein
MSWSIGSGSASNAYSDKSPPTQSGPIKLEGFNVPSSSSSSGYVDPSMLRGSMASGRGGNGGYGASGTGGGGFSDLDLDFNTLSTLIPHTSYDESAAQQSQYAGGGAGYAGGAGGAFDAFGYQQQQQQSTRAQASGGDYLQGMNAPPTSSLPQYFSTAGATRGSPSFSAFAAASPVDSRSPSVFNNINGQDDSPGAEVFGSYSSSVGGESLTTAAASSVNRRPSPPDRSRSTGVGKAPNSSSRSRSARRASTSVGVAYQALGGATASQHGASAIVIPSSNLPSTSRTQQQHAISMPAYTNANAGLSSSWFATSQAIAFAHSTTKEEPMDSTGWKPSARQTGGGMVPSSAPTMGGKKASAKGLDDVLEDPAMGQYVPLPISPARSRTEEMCV